MRTVRGTVLVPAEARPGTGLMLVEARDVSVMDAPSVVVAEQRVPAARVEPGERLSFELAVPESDPGRSLSLRVHLSYDGTPTVSSGDAISVVHIPIPAAGDVDDLEVSVRVI
ncbi:MAG TPA: YbaY family lipoprotein [Candidatus Limnocylindrales bacterium]|nr:YbaY family lipoprotein [Candidatus Limnocylindrales bacterium]